MKKLCKILLPIAAALVVLGGALFTVGLAQADWDFTALSDSQVEQLEFSEPLNESYNRVELVFENADINLQFSDEIEQLRIEYPHIINRKGESMTELTVTEAENGVTIHEAQIWHRQLFTFFNYTDAKVNVYLPRERSYHLTVFTDNGDISIDTGSKAEDGQALAEYVRLDSDNGTVTVADSSSILCYGSFNVHTDNGDVSLGHVEAGSFYVETDNGDVTLMSGHVTGEARFLSDNGSITVKGDLNAKNIVAESDNGKIRLDGNVASETVRIETDNSDIHLGGRLDAKQTDLQTDNGDIYARLAGVAGQYSIALCEGGEWYTQVADSEKGEARVFGAESDNGEVELMFLGELMAGE